MVVTSQAYFAYIHAKPSTLDAFGIFYVGKGKISRAYHFKRGDNRHYNNTVSKYGRNNILVGKLECSSEQIALGLEVGLIKYLRRMGVKLANKNNGGGGFTSDVIKALWTRPEFRESAITGMREAHKRPEVKAAYLRAAQARLNDPKYCEAQAVGNKKSWENPARRAAASVRASSVITITDGLLERRIPKDDIVPVGWYRGRCAAVVEKARIQATAQSNTPEAKAAFVANITRPEARAKHAATLKEYFATPEGKADHARRCGLRRGKKNKRVAVRPHGDKIWVTDDVSSRKIAPNAPLPEGWRRGKTHTKTKKT